MKGGFILAFGIIFIIIVMMLLLVIVVCTSPGNTNAAYCTPFSPIVDIFRDIF